MGWFRRTIGLTVLGLCVPAAAEPPPTEISPTEISHTATRPTDTRPTDTRPTETPTTEPAASASTQPADRPILQLTATLPEKYNDPKNTASSGDILVREIQRQAVLIAAREELGLRTRDMVLDEPFAPQSSPGVSTVLIHTQAIRNREILFHLGRYDLPGTSADPYWLADIPLDSKSIKTPFTATIPIKESPVFDYPGIVRDSESASRFKLIDSLKAENVLGGQEPDPTKWVDDSPADPLVAQWAPCADPFHQYLVVREMHRRMRADGASFQRVDALVRAYADLSMQTGMQWSWATDVFEARALLYAERLVVHEKSSPRSLYTRAYARAEAGLCAPALEDLDAADRAGGKPPAWAVMVRALARYDVDGLVDAYTSGPWSYRATAGTFLTTAVLDGFPTPTGDAVASRVIAENPGAFYISEANGNTQYTANAASSFAIVLRNAMHESRLPAKLRDSVASIKATALISTEADGYIGVAGVRDQLAAAAGADTIEPSLGVFSGLVQQQAFAAVVRRASTECSAFAAGNNDITGLEKYAELAKPILKLHPWGVMVSHLRSGTNPIPDKEFEKVLARPRARDNGWWIDTVNNHVVLTDGEQKKLDETWVNPGHRLSAQTAYQYYNTSDARAAIGQASMVPTEQLWKAYRDECPYCALLTADWINSVPRERFITDKSLYDDAVGRVEQRFFNRPDLIDTACDLCELRGDFDRSFSMLSGLSMIVPSSHVFDRMARTSRHLGRREQAIECIDRGLKIAPTEPYNTTNANALQILRARIQADDGKYDDALTTLAKLETSPYGGDLSYLLLEARCYEATNGLDEAETCFRTLANSSAPQLYQAYFFARRTNRPDADSLHKTAQAQVADQIEPKLMLLLADGNDSKALETLKDQSGIGNWLQLERLILATELKKPPQVTVAIDSIAPYNPTLGRVIRQVVAGKDLPDSLRQFDQFEANQLNTEELVRYDSVMGRYLIAAGHKEDGIRYLTRALRRPDREQDGYFLAWLAAGKLGLDPAALALPGH